MKTGMAIALALFMALAATAQGSPYDGVHVATLEIPDAAGVSCLYVWIPFVTPKTWVALHPTYLKFDFPGMDYPGFVSVGNIALAVPDNLQKSIAARVWSPLASSSRLPLNVRQETDGQRIFRGIYRISFPDAAPLRGRTTMAIESDVALEGTVCATSLGGLEGMIDRSF
jgi:hypothetical protein